MTLLHYSLSSNAYKSNIFTGFSQLQKQEDFVDLTLAADGYIVKVHRNIIALASPYLKEILKSMSSYSPVIYLNNVSQKILSYLLEYIYHGEVNIPADSVDAFVEVSKSLHIAGIEDLEPPKMKPKLNAKRKKPPERRASNIAAHITINSHNLLEVQQYPPSDHFENNDNYETDYSMEDHNQQQQTNLINNDKFIIQQNETGKNLSIVQENQESCDRETIQNIPVIEIQSEEKGEMHTKTGKFSNNNLLQSQTDDTIQIPNQLNLTNTLENHDVIQMNTNNMSTAAQHSQTNRAHIKDYKIIVKTQNDTVNQASETEALQSNIPVIEIQHIGFTDQQEPNMTFQDQNTTLPVWTDTVTQPFQDNATLPIQTEITQNNLAMPEISRPIIKILDDQIIKSAVNSSEMDVGQQISLGDKEVNIALPPNYKANINDLKGMSLFSITERGALQLILNRFIYCSHHSSRTKRRWRCVDYRRGGCPALVDTENGAIVARKGVHGHKFHDSKIYKKHEKGFIYQTIHQAVAARDLKQKDSLKIISNDQESD